MAKSSVRPGLHIAFTGIDGAGKSTQAAKLAKFLRDNYGPTYFFESREDLVSQLTTGLAWRYGQCERREYYGHFALDLAKSFDVVREYFSVAAPLLAAGMNVVSPRSVYCRLGLSIGLSGIRDERIVQVLSLVPEANLTIWLDIDPKFAMLRIAERGTDEEDITYLRAFQGALATMAESAEWTRVDAGRDSELVFKDIVRAFKERLSDRN